MDGNGGGDKDGPVPLPATARLDDPKPSYLDQVCSPSSLASPLGLGQCADACRPSRFCHPETYVCEVASKEKRWCSDYELQGAVRERRGELEGEWPRGGVTRGGNGDGAVDDRGLRGRPGDSEV